MKDKIDESLKCIFPEWSEEKREEISDWLVTKRNGIAPIEIMLEFGPERFAKAIEEDDKWRQLQ